MSFVVEIEQIYAFITVTEDVASQDWKVTSLTDDEVRRTAAALAQSLLRSSNARPGERWSVIFDRSVGPPRCLRQ